MTRAPEDLEPGTIRNLDRFLDAVEQMDMGPLGHFTCTETELLADAMTAQRGPDKGMWVIIHHLVDSEDEEDEELEAHLDRWPDLAADLRRYVSEDSRIIQQLTELEKRENEPEEDDPTALWTPEMTAAAIRERAQGPAETFGRMYELNEHSEEL